MPFDSNGRFSLAPGYLGITGQTILTTQHNPPLEDIASGLSVTLLRTGVAPMLANLPMGGFKITGLAAGVAATDAVNRGQLDSATPVGAVIDFAGSTAPAGWLLCYGQAVSRTTYTALFAVIGTTYGAGDGSTFNLPDARGRVAAGKDNMGGAAASRLTGQSGGVAGTTLGGSGGVETHTLTTAQLASHTHTGTTSASGTHTHNITSANNQNGTGGFGVPNFGGGSGLNKLTDPGGDHTHTFTSDSAGTGAAHNNVQPTIIFNKIIRTGV